MKEMWKINQSATQNGEIDLHIYGDVQGDDVNWWTGDVIESETSANHFRQELAKYPDCHKINIFINSYGGSVFEGTAIYNQLRRHPARKVVYIDGFACSIASVIAMAGDEIVMPKNTLMMIHNMWRGVYGNAAELRKAADDLDTINAAGRAAYLQKAGDKITEEKLVEMMDAETWLTAEECIHYGLADKIDDKEADMENADAILQHAKLGIQQKIKIQRSIAAQLRDIGKETQKVGKEEKTGSIMEMISGFYNG